MIRASIKTKVAVLLKRKHIQRGNGLQPNKMYCLLEFTHLSNTRHDQNLILSKQHLDLKHWLKVTKTYPCHS